MSSAFRGLNRGTARVVGLSAVLWAAPRSLGLGVTLYSDYPSFQAATAGRPTSTEPFDATGLLSTTHVTSTDGGIGAAGGVLSGSVWKDVVSRSLGESSQFSFDSTSLIGAGAFFDTSPGGFAQGISITEFLTPSQAFPFGGQLNVNTSIGPINGGFFGWTSSDPFSFFTMTAGPFSGGLESFDMDNLIFVAVPEPAGLGMIAIGATILTPRRRRDRCNTF